MGVTSGWRIKGVADMARALGATELILW